MLAGKVTTFLDRHSPRNKSVSGEFAELSKLWHVCEVTYMKHSSNRKQNTAATTSSSIFNDVILQVCENGVRLVVYIRWTECIVQIVFLHNVSGVESSPVFR